MNYPRKNDKTHVHYQTLRTMIPSCIFIAIDIPEVLFDDSIMKTYLRNIPNFVKPHDYARSIFHSMTTCLFSLASPISKCVYDKTSNTRESRKQAFIFEQILTPFRRLTFPLSILLGPTYYVNLSTQLFNLAQSLPLRFPLAPQIYCALTRDFAICIHSDEVISISLSHFENNVTTFYLDHPTVLSMNTLSTIEPTHTIGPTYIKDNFRSSMIPITAAYLSAAPALLRSTANTKYDTIAFTRLNPRSVSRNTHDPFLPLSAFSMALTIAFPVIMSSLMHPAININILEHSQTSFIPIIEHRTDNIYFLAIITSITSIANHIKRIHNELCEEEDSTINDYRFNQLPQEIQDQIIEDLCVSQPSTCSCHEPRQPVTPVQKRQPYSTYILTPIYQQKLTAISGDRTILNLYHFEDRNRTPDVPRTATYLQSFLNSPTIEFRCQCHFQHMSPGHDEPHLITAPSYIRNFLNKNDPFHSDYQPHVKTCPCN